MVISKADADWRYEKMAVKKDVVGITVSKMGIFQCWKDDSLEYCDYVMYDRGALLYRKGSTFLASNDIASDSRSIYFSGSHTLLAEMEDCRYQFARKKHPLTDDYSFVTVFRHGEKIILIIADVLFSTLPEIFEFPATTSSERLCLATARQVISLRDQAAGDRLKLWLQGIHHPLGKLPKRSQSLKSVVNSEEAHSEEVSIATCQDVVFTQSAENNSSLPSSL